MVSIERAQELIDDLYHRANQKSRGTLGIFRLAIGRFLRVQGIEAAAAIAYFAIFSLFPLLLILISVAGFFLQGELAISLVIELVEEFTPTYPQWLDNILRQVAERRELSGIIGLVGLVLSASGVFTTLARNINRAWPNANRQGVFRPQLIALALVLILANVMILWIIWSWMISLLVGAALPYLQQFLPADILDKVINPIGKLFPFLASFFVLLIIYRWMPNTRVRWSEAIWGALISNFAWIFLTLIFQWFLRSGLARYDLVYGSLGTSVALLTWTFLSAVIILFGSHISSAIARSRGLARKETSPSLDDEQPLMESTQTDTQDPSDEAKNSEEAPIITPNHKG